MCDISVIILLHNQPASFKYILRSLSAQTFTGRYELLATDDGSDEIATRQYAELIQRSMRAATYLRQEHRGFRAAAARNNAIRLAKGKIILFLDGDVVPKADVLEHHYHLHTTSHMMIAGSRAWSGQLTADLDHRLDAVPIKDALRYLECEHVADVTSQQRQSTEAERRAQWAASRRPWRACLSSHLSVTRSDYVYFDEEFKGWGAEDIELAYRLCVRHNYAAIYDPTILAFHLERRLRTSISNSSSQQETELIFPL